MTTGTKTQRPAVFTPEAVSVINRAYARALEVIRTETGLDQLRLHLADYIMFLARNGETDEERLCRLAVAEVLGRTHVGPVTP